MTVQDLHKCVFRGGHLTRSKFLSLFVATLLELFGRSSDRLSLPLILRQYKLVETIEL